MPRLKVKRGTCVISWLAGLPFPLHPHPEPSTTSRAGIGRDETKLRKRKRQTSATDYTRPLVSPPNSPASATSRGIPQDHMCDSVQEDGSVPADATTPPPAKRSRQHVDDSDLTPTPRPIPSYPATSAVTLAPVTTLGPAASSDSASASETSSVTSSYYSKHSFASPSLTAKEKKRRRQSSPRKQTRIMAMERAFVPVSFGSTLDPPVALDALVNRIIALQKGRGVISHTERESVESEARGNRQFSWVEEQSFASSPTTTSTQPLVLPRDELGPTPSIQDVKRIWSDAEDCQTFQHIEGQWNCA
ncbi:hypothetical protein CSUB01_12678, partial [Colletotrichum sublineola]